MTLSATAARSKSPSQQRGMSVRQIQFLAIGGSIGAGLFVASGDGVHAGGPSLIFAYLVTGAIVFIIARCLAEMALVEPQRTFIGFVGQHLGHHAGFACGWSYFLLSILIAMAEMTAVGAMIHGWLPAIPQWLPVAIVTAFLFGINHLRARAFGEIEFWIALLKVTAIVGFVGLGLVAVLAPSLFPDSGVSVTNLWRHGGIFPNGVGGFVETLPIALFSFGGVELVGLVSAETHDPRIAIPKAVNGLIIRMLVFYVATMTIAMIVVPWDTIGAGSSPFTLVLQHLKIPGIAIGLNVIVITALISAINTVTFATGRVVASLAVEGYAPTKLAFLDRNGVPRRAVTIAMALISVSVVLNYLLAASIFKLLLTGVAGIVLMNWILFVTAHLRFRQTRRRAQLVSPLPVPLTPFSNIAVLVFLISLLALLTTAASLRSALLLDLGVVALLVTIAHLRMSRAAPA